jgi:M6 family metalloprotease-like protein
MSVPFHGEEFTFKQPDGTEILVRGWGDQHNARFETLDGFPVMENPATGFYEYAAVHATGEEVRPTGIRADVARPAGAESVTRLLGNRAAAKVRAQISSGLPRGVTRWEERRQESRMALLEGMIPGIAPAPPRRKTVGNYVGLCLLVQFPDVTGEIRQQEVEAFCNQHGYAGYGNNGSVYDYFAENSLDKLHYTNIVVPYYTAKRPRSYYTDETVEQPIRAWELITEALDQLRADGFDFSKLTSDDQEYVYALNVFYAGRRVNNWAKGLWPHSYRLKDPYTLMPGKLAFDYQITDIGRELTLGTFCHENGHMICNFPDLYDYGGDSEGMGIYCLMCAGGAVGAANKNPTNISAYLKHAAGWTGSLIQITDGLTAAATAGMNQFFMHSKSPTEYFILENRYAEGRDKYLTDSGLAICHVDHLGSNDNQAGTPSSHYECALMQADGENDLERGENIGDDKDLFNAEGITRFGDATKPNSKWWDRKSSGLEIYNIGPGGREITFSAKIL